MSVTFEQVRGRTVCTPIYRLRIGTNNLVQNSSFEDTGGGVAAWTPRWNRSDTDKIYVTTAAPAPHGLRVLFMKAYAADTTITADNEDYPCPVTIGTKYTLSLRWRWVTEPVGFALTFRVKFYQQDMTYISDSDDLADSADIGEWQDFSLIATAPALAAWAVLEFEMTHDAQEPEAEIDRVQFEPDPLEGASPAPTPYLGSYLDLMFSTHAYLHDDPRLVNPGGGRRTFIEGEGRYEHTLNLPQIANQDGFVNSMIRNRAELLDALEGKDVACTATFEEADVGEDVPVFRGTIGNIEYKNRNIIPSVDEITKSLLAGKLPQRQTWGETYIPIAYGLRNGSQRWWKKVHLKPIQVSVKLTVAVGGTSDTTWDVDDASKLPDPALFTVWNNGAPITGQVTIECGGEYLYYTARDLENNQITVVRQDPTQYVTITNGKPGDRCDGVSKGVAGDDVNVVGLYLVAENAEWVKSAAWYFGVWYKEDDETVASQGEWGHPTASPATRSAPLCKVCAPYDDDHPQYAVLALSDAPVKIKYGAADTDGFVRRFPDLYLDIDLQTGTLYNPCEVLHDLLTNTDYGAGLSMEHFPDEWYNALDDAGDVDTDVYLTDYQCKTIIGYDGQMEIEDIVGKFCMEMFARFFFTTDGLARLKVIRPPIRPIDLFLNQDMEAIGEIQITEDFTQTVPKVIVRTARNWTYDGQYDWEASEELTNTSFYPRIKNKEPFVIESLFIRDLSGSIGQALAEKYIARYGYADVKFTADVSLWALGRELFNLLWVTAGSDKDVGTVLSAITAFELSRLTEGIVGLEATSYESWLAGHWGRWTSDAANDYADADDDERQICGYWSDNNGYADPAYASSFMWSRWF